MALNELKYIEVEEYKGKKGIYNLINLNLKDNKNSLDQFITGKIRGEFAILFEDYLKEKSNCINLSNMEEMDLDGVIALLAFSGRNRSKSYEKPVLIINEYSKIDRLLNACGVRDNSFKVVYSLDEL